MSGHPDPAEPVISRARRLCREAEPHPQQDVDPCARHLQEARRQEWAAKLVR